MVKQRPQNTTTSASDCLTAPSFFRICSLFKDCWQKSLIMFGLLSECNGFSFSDSAQNFLFWLLIKNALTVSNLSMEIGGVFKHVQQIQVQPASPHSFFFLFERFIEHPRIITTKYQSSPYTEICENKNAYLLIFFQCQLYAHID